MFKAERKRQLSLIATWSVFVMLVLALVYSIFGTIAIETGRAPLARGHLFTRPPTDYVKILLQSLLGLAIIFLPALMRKKLRLNFTDGMQIIFVFFLYGAIILGETMSYYRKYSNWDTMLHTLSGVLLGAFGFTFIDMLNDHEKVRLNLPAGFVSIFSFCFAVTLGVFWEMIEWVMDLVMDLDMQQYRSWAGAILAGRAAVYDTMKDLLVDALGAAVIALAGYFMIRKKIRQRGRVDKYAIG
jgi:uncharacterized membrane protein YjdF